jgi:hypothetical protein
MELEEFEALALAWGADVARWPADLQASARDLITARAAEAQTVLNDAGLLDLALRASTLPIPSLELRAKIIAAAPQPLGRFPSWRGWFGAALAASCAAGAVAAVLAISLGLFPDRASISADPAADAARLLPASSDATVG